MVRGVSVGSQLGTHNAERRQFLGKLDVWSVFSSQSGCKITPIEECAEWLGQILSRKWLVQTNHWCPCKLTPSQRYFHSDIAIFSCHYTFKKCVHLWWYQWMSDRVLIGSEFLYMPRLLTFSPHVFFWLIEKPVLFKEPVFMVGYLAYTCNCFWVAVWDVNFILSKTYLYSRHQSTKKS